jgi:hypothetical protein
MPGLFILPVLLRNTLPGLPRTWRWAAQVKHTRTDRAARIDQQSCRRTLPANILYTKKTKGSAMIKRLACLAVLACLCLYMPAHAGQKKIIAVGDIFPAVKTDFAFSAPELEYLGIDRGILSLFTRRSVAIPDINTEIILVEFFNNYCSSCQAQAPVMNEVFNFVQKSSALRNKVRFIGIGAGNNEREVAQFKERHDVPFPLFADQRFSFYDAIGEPGGTPFMLILKKRGPDAVVVGTHMGLTPDAKFFITSLKTAAEQDVGALTRRVTEQDIPRDDPRMLKLNLTQKQQLDRVAQSMAAACANCTPPADIKQIATPSGRMLYATAAVLNGKPLTLYSMLFSQQPLCDVCHGIHYIITFDADGIIRDFMPLHITKYGNIEWNEYDIDNMRKQLLGKRLKKELVFDPGIDAVSTATMSSSLIYKGVNELRSVYKELR